MRIARWLALCAASLALTAAPATAAPSPAPIEVVPGVALMAGDGSITFTGGGFAAGSPVRVSVNGAPFAATRSQPSGSFAISLRLTGAGNQSLAATGVGSVNQPYVVTASIHIGPNVPLLPKEARLASAGPGRVYGALAMGFASVVLGVALFLGMRLSARRRPLSDVTT